MYTDGRPRAGKKANVSYVNLVEKMVGGTNEKKSEPLFMRQEVINRDRFTGAFHIL
jgi:hypothetical protein